MSQAIFRIRTLIISLHRSRTFNGFVLLSVLLSVDFDVEREHSRFYGLSLCAFLTRRVKCGLGSMQARLDRFARPICLVTQDCRRKRVDDRAFTTSDIGSAPRT